MGCNYYAKKFGVDVRGLRYPGLISTEALPSGGTTDYSVEMFYEALETGKYECYLSEHTALPMMFMSDAVQAAIDLMQADACNLSTRMCYNVSSFSLTPKALASAVKLKLPHFEVSYKVDELRQSIADSWPDSLDCSDSVKDWNFS